MDAFGYGPELVRAKIATGAEAERQAEARAYYAEQRAAGTLPVDEKSLKRRSAEPARDSRANRGRGARHNRDLSANLLLGIGAGGARRVR